MGFFDSLFNHAFLQNALLAGLLASVACGVVGSYVVSRRISMVAGSIAHCVLGGMGAARYLEVVYGWNWLHPLHGAILASLAAAITIGWVTLRASEREDSIIGAIWAIGMAIGIVFISQTPGYSQDLMGYLFGNILIVGRSDLYLIAALDAIVLLICLLRYNRLQAVCFDPEFARVRGVNVELYYVLLLCLTAITVVILIDVVGIVMVIALLTLPAAIAGRLVNSLWKMMIVGGLLCVFFVGSGLWTSYTLELPSGATIILITGLVYFATLIIGGRGNRLRRIDT